jgi:hypothetical protein
MKIIITIEMYKRIKPGSSELHEDFFINFKAHIKYAEILKNKMESIGTCPYIGDGTVIDYYYGY